MANKLYNLAGMDSATTGTGTLTLGNALSGLLTFAGAGVQNGDVVSYSIVDGANTEVGTGTYSSTGPTLARTTVVNSTNSGNKINCSGSQKVYISILASDLAQYLPKTDFDDLQRFGFLNRVETRISFDGTSIFTLSDAGSGWSYWRSGLKYTVSGNKTVDLLDVENPLVDGRLYYIYIDSTTGVLSAATGTWTLNDTKVPVATLFWNNTLSPKWVMADERHQVTIDRAFHREHHFTDGTEIKSHGTLSGLTTGSTTPANKVFGLSGVQIFDEDLYYALADITDPDGATPTYYNLYRTGASSYAYEISDMPFKYTTSAGPTYGYIEYDSSGTSTQMSTNNRYCNTYIFACNSVVNTEADPEINTAGTRFFIMQGRAIYNSLALAQAEKFAASAGMPVAEGVAIWQLTWFNGTLANSIKGRCQLAGYQQMTANITVSTAIPVGVHNDLAGLDGGTTGEYYHLTSAQHTVVGNTSGTNTGDQTGDGLTITGTGTLADPFVATPSSSVADGVTITGAGTIADPFVAAAGTASAPSALKIYMASNFI